MTTAPVVAEDVGKKAGALSALGGEPERLVWSSEGTRILPPHPGEAARLLGREVPRDGDGRRDFAAELARGTKSIVCLKGRGTVVSDGERNWTNDTGNAGMATAGAGDVLAGILVAYLARGAAPFDACRWAVHVHGLAGDLAAAVRGMRAVIASDLIDHLGQAQLQAGIDGTG